VIEQPVLPEKHSTFAVMSGLSRIHLWHQARAQETVPRYCTDGVDLRLFLLKSMARLPTI
jgi:hypothetical protein